MKTLLAALFVLSSMPALAGTIQCQTSKGLFSAYVEPLGLMHDVVLDGEDYGVLSPISIAAPRGKINYQYNANGFSIEFSSSVGEFEDYENFEARFISMPVNELVECREGL